MSKTFPGFVATLLGLSSAMAPNDLHAQTPWLANESVVFGLQLNAYAQENAQAGQTSWGAGIGALLGHGVTQYLLPLIAVDVGVVRNDAYLARTIGHADLALRAQLPLAGGRAKPFAHVAFSSQLIERPASADDLLRTGFTAGAGVELRQSSTRAVELVVRRTWLKDSDEQLQAVDKDVYRLHFGLMWRPPR